MTRRPRNYFKEGQVGNSRPAWPLTQYEKAARNNKRRSSESQSIGLRRQDYFCLHLTHALMAMTTTITASMA